MLVVLSNKPNAR